jgi:hypothetical protein
VATRHRSHLIAAVLNLKERIDPGDSRVTV